MFSNHLYTRKVFPILAAVLAARMAHAAPDVVIGTKWGSGILWSSMAVQDADHGVHHGVLRALDAQTLQQLWFSDGVAADNAGNWPKFSGPLVANGRVYLASFPANGTGGEVVNVYGLKP